MPTCSMLWQRRSASVGSATPGRSSPARCAARSASSIAATMAGGGRVADRTSSSLAPVRRSYKVSSNAPRCRAAHAAIAVASSTTTSRGPSDRTSELSRDPRREVVDLVLVALDQLDDDGVLRREVVIQAAGQDPAGVGNVLE